MPTTTEIINSLNASATRADTSSLQLYGVANGPASGAGSTVSTDNGPVPTLAKWFADNQAAIDVIAGLAADLANEGTPTQGAARIGRASQVVDSMAGLRALSKTSASKFALAIGHGAANDGGGGQYRLDLSDTTSADNNCTVIVALDGGRWKLVFSGTLDARQAGAKGDGTGADAAALQAAFSAAGAVQINSPLTLTSSVTVPPGKQLRFSGAGTITLSAGVTLTVGEIVADTDRQIIYGTGAVSGLAVCRVGWFAGDKINVVTDARAEIQRAYDACAEGAEVLWPSGYLCITGATAITASVGQRTRGVSVRASRLFFTTPACNGLSITGGGGGKGSVEDLFIGSIDRSVLPTSGTALLASRELVKISRVVVDGVYIGIEFPFGSAGSAGDQFEVRNAIQVGVYAHDTNDIYLHQFQVVSYLDRTNLSGVTGTFVANETVTTNTGKQGLLVERFNSTLVTVYWYAQVPGAGETMTGGTSGATATITSVIVGHQLGGIRLQDKTEAIVISDCDVIGGVHSLTTDASTYGVGTRPAYNKFNQCYFDTADNGAVIEKSVETEFSACWFSNRPGPGVTVLNSDGIRFLGGGAINCGGHGASVASTAKRVTFSGFAARGNGTLASNTYDGINIGAGTTDFSVVNCVLGGDAAMGFGQQRTGVRVEAGASDRYVIKQNLIFGNTTAGVTDGGTGVNKSVADNY